MATSIYDIAKKIGLSASTVSRALNDDPRVAAATKKKVEQATKELGYYRNDVARSLRSHQSLAIGLIIPNVNNPVFAEITRTIEQVCAQEGYLLTVCNGDRDPTHEKQLVHMLRTKQTDGVIVMPSQPPLELIQPLQQVNIPVIVLEHCLPEVHCIFSDDFQGGRLATQYLLSLGHQRIGYLKRETPVDTNTGLQRLLGYREALESAGMPFDPSLVIECGPTSEAAYLATQQLLTLTEPPTAIFAHNDIIALGAIRAIKYAGLFIPDDISVIGYDDIVMAAYLETPLSTVRYPKVEMGTLAGRMILQLIKSKNILSPQCVKLPIELVVRASTGPPPPESGSISFS